jgi:hypothetical protein
MVMLEQPLAVASAISDFVGGILISLNRWLRFLAASRHQFYQQGFILQMAGSAWAGCPLVSRIARG